MTEYPRTTTYDCPDCGGEREFIIDIRSLDVYECSRCGYAADISEALDKDEGYNNLREAVKKMRSTSDDDDEDSSGSSTSPPYPI